MAQRKDGREKRDALLEAALDVFIEKGYPDATVAEISQHADANIAAINYHFGSKEALYIEVWTRAFAQADREAPWSGAVAENAPPQQRLKGMIAGVLSRILKHGAQSRSGRLLLQEMARPTAVLNETRRAATEPIRNKMFTICAQLLGPESRPAEAAKCAQSIMHQMLAIGFRGGKKPLLLGEGAFTDAEVDELIEHTYRFSMGGIAAVRNWVEQENP